jgi:MOSC domain-containing protein YiiM
MSQIDLMRQKGQSSEVRIAHLYVSRGHNFFGHHGRAAGINPTLACSEIQCVAGRGIVGDRFFDNKPNHAGQITFFALETYEALCRELNVRDKEPAVFRRNVITTGVDLNEWIGQEFEIQGVLFRGTEECKPCYWMDQAFAVGAEKFLREQGGLRAMILTDGILHSSNL